MPKRYIEDVLPLGELNKYDQKGGGIGSLSAMHLSFVRRPPTASRAMTLAALVDTPTTEAERQTLEQLLVELSSEEWLNKPVLLEHARALVRQAHDGRAPRVLDPFAGGGLMPLEALRLGCEATALDLNPVAYLALIASLVYPQKFGKWANHASRITDEAGPIGYLEDIHSDLCTTIRRYLERFWAAGIGGADFFMSAIGPGLSVFSRYARVERYDGNRVDVGDFLDLVRHEVAAFAIERIVGDEGFSERLDQPTQFYLLWRWGYGEWDVPDGEAVLLSTAVGIDLGVLMDCVGLVGKVKGKLRLLSPTARVAKLEKVMERVAAGGAVPLVDVLHGACLLWQADRQEDLAALIAARGGELWPVAQAVVELLSRDNAERKALMSLLGTRVDLEHRAQRWAETHRPQPRVEQLKLWRED